MTMKPDIDQPFTRYFTFEREVVDAQARTVELAFSSEAPVERLWGVEILDHAPESVDLSRLLDGAPLLRDHDARTQVGVIESAWIGADRRGRARVRFSRSRAGEEELQDVIDGIRTKVSVGYQVQAVKHELSRDGVDTYRMTRWTPFEVSIVSIPADNSVGVGRSAGNHQENPMSEVAQAPAAAPVASAPAAAAAPSITVDDRATRRLAEVDEMIRIGEQYAERGGREVAAQAIRDGKDIRWMTDELLKRAMSQASPASAGEIGMSKAEQKRYSVLRLLRALATPNDRTLQRAAAFEFEAHQAAVEALGGQSRGGIVIPMDVFKRDMTVAGVSGSNYLVGTTNMPGGLIELLRNRMVTTTLGARRLDGLVGNMTIPRLSAASTAYWLSTETSTITESQPTIGQLQLAPKNVGALVEVTRQMMLQSTPDVEQLVMDDLLNVIAIAIDKAALNGTGLTGQPTGVSATANIGSVTGTSIDYAKVLEFQTDVAAANALAGNLAYVTTPAVAALLKQRMRVTSTDSALWTGNISDGSLEGYRAMSTNQIAASSMIFGDWSQLVIASWGSVELATSDSDGTNFQTGVTSIRAMASVDIGVRIPAAFSLATSIT